VEAARAGGSGAGKRRAVKHAGRRAGLVKGLPSAPVVLGLATMAVAVFGTLTSTDAETVATQAAPAKITAASALSGLAGVGTVGGRENPVSRDSGSDAMEDAAGEPLSEPAESLAKQRAGALANLARAAQNQAKKYAENQWGLPLQGYRLTATYGEYGLWANYHTGLDFAAPSGTPLVAMARGVVTSTGYDGAYGNKTVITLEDGTELWYCHQTSISVSPGDTVQTGQVIGSVGSTGNVTGPHLHLEVRPGGGDPVDPYAAMVQNGVTP
jgi:murein DD-endopeptidase MepM/ murein hydrolase activator NlpD